MFNVTHHYAVFSSLLSLPLTSIPIFRLQKVELTQAEQSTGRSMCALRAKGGMNVWLFDFVTTWLCEWVTMWLCDRVTMWLGDYVTVTMWLSEHVTVWLWLTDWLTIWLCDYVTVWLWLCDCVTRWLCDGDYVAKWACDCVTVTDYVTVWLCDRVTVTMWLWLCDYVTVWLLLCRPVAQRASSTLIGLTKVGLRTPVNFTLMTNIKNVSETSASTHYWSVLGQGRFRRSYGSV